MSEQICMVLAQINVMMGAIEQNAHQIIDAAKQARELYQADVILFPELVLTGYPPEDLLYRTELHVRVAQALESIASAVPDIYIVLGHPYYDRESGQLYNSASLLYGGVALYRYSKRHLPNYAVFDEKRYFTTGNAPGIIAIKGHKIGLLICEDLWMPGPVKDLADQGAEMIWCINASPFHLRKHLERLSTIHVRQQTEAKLPIVYLNLIGGQDEFVFDGDSFIVDAAGNCPVRLPPFQPAMTPITAIRDQTGWTFTAPESAEPLSDEGSLYQALVLGTRDYCKKNGFEHALIGLSGGIDSALTAAIAADALGPQNITAVAMPSRYTQAMSIEDAKQQAKNLGISYLEISIEPMYEASVSSLSPAFSGLAIDTTEENIQARCRGIILMALSNKRGQIVLSTSNKSEIAVGYSTLYGDMCGGFCVLKDLPKMLVYRLAHYRNSLSPVIPTRVITRAPSAELRPDQTDQDSLPTYEILDHIIQRYVEEDQSIDDIVTTGIDEPTVRRVIAMIDRNEYKRRQSPPGPRLSKRAFGRDWRYPITNGFGK